jgi:hypothetical protein
MSFHIYMLVPLLIFLQYYKALNRSTVKQSVERGAAM